MTDIFDGYTCGVTGLPCCGCNFYCANRQKAEVTEPEEVVEE